MNHINRYTIELFIFLLVSIILIVLGAVFLVKYIRKHEAIKLIECIVGIALSVVFFVFLTLPYCQDLKYYVKGEWIEAEVTALSWDRTGTELAPEERKIKVKNNATGEEVTVRFYTKQRIETGDIYRIKYLPYTKTAQIIEIIYSAESG